jgi:hypothetical protein
MTNRMKIERSTCIVANTNKDKICNIRRAIVVVVAAEKNSMNPNHSDHPRSFPILFRPLFYSSRYAEI